MSGELHDAYVRNLERLATAVKSAAVGFWSGRCARLDVDVEGVTCADTPMRPPCPCCAIEAWADAERSEGR